MTYFEKLIANSMHITVDPHQFAVSVVHPALTNLGMRKSDICMLLRHFRDLQHQYLTEPGAKDKLPWTESITGELDPGHIWNGKRMYSTCT